MAFRDIRAALEWLERTGRLVDVDSELSPRHEIGAFLAVASKRERRAYRFGKVARYAVPVVANLVHDRSVLAAAMGVDGGQLIAAAFGARLAEPITPRPLPARRSASRRPCGAARVRTLVVGVLVHSSPLVRIRIRTQCPACTPSRATAARDEPLGPIGQRGAALGLARRSPDEDSRERLDLRPRSSQIRTHRDGVGARKSTR